METTLFHCQRCVVVGKTSWAETRKTKKKKKNMERKPKLEKKMETKPNQTKTKVKVGQTHHRSVVVAR